MYRSKPVWNQRGASILFMLVVLNRRECFGIKSRCRWSNNNLHTCRYVPTYRCTWSIVFVQVTKVPNRNNGIWIWDHANSAINGATYELIYAHLVSRGWYMVFVEARFVIKMSCLFSSIAHSKIWILLLKAGLATE